MFFKNKKVIISLSAIALIIISIIAFNYVNIGFKKDNNTKVGEIKIDKKEVQKNTVNLTKDKRDNMYKDIYIPSQGLKTKIPLDWKSKYDDKFQTYYFELSPNAQYNQNTFTIMIAMRVVDLAEEFYDGEIGMNNVKDALVDSTKASILYTPDEIDRPLQISHINMGKNHQISNDMSFEIINDLTFVNDLNPMESIKAYGEIFYKKVGNKAIQIMAYGPNVKEKDISLIGAEFAKNLNTGNLDKNISLKPLDTKIEKEEYSFKTNKNFNVTEGKNGTVVRLNKDPIKEDNGIILTVGADGADASNDKIKLKKVLSYDKPEGTLFKFPFSSLLDFGGHRTNESLLLPTIKKKEFTRVSGFNAVKYTLEMDHENVPEADSSLLEHPLYMTTYVVKLNKDRLGFVSVKYPKNSKDLAERYLERTVKTVKFKNFEK